MKNGLFNKRIPTIFAFLGLILAIGISVTLIQSGIFYQGKAAPDDVPRNALISNITDTSFTVTYTTTAQVEGVITILESTSGTTLILDDRDKKTGVKNKYYSHHVSAQDLKPKTKYVFKILSGGNEYADPSYTITTGDSISTPPPAQNPLFGKIKLPDGTVGSDTIVTAKTNSSSLISAVTDSKGEFILPTNSLRNKTNNSYEIVNNSTSFEINVFRQDLKSNITTDFQTAQNLPPVTLSQQYSFREENEEKINESNEFTFTQDFTGSKTVSIVVPEEDEFFIDNRPQFSGTSYPNSNVSISITGLPDSEIVSKADGSWVFTPQSVLTQGSHRITIRTGFQGNIESDSKTFSIFPSGSQVTESATPSATPTSRPTNTPTPTPSPTLTPTIAPSPTPTPSPRPTIVQPSITSSPSPTVEPTPTPSPLPTIPTTPTPIPSIAQPGEFGNTLALGGISAALIIIGAILFFAI